MNKKNFFLIALFVLVSNNSESREKPPCLRLMDVSHRAVFIGIAEPIKIFRYDNENKIGYDVKVTNKIKPGTKKVGDPISWVDVSDFSIRKKKLIFLFENNEVAAFDLEQVGNEKYVRVSIGGSLFFMLSPETTYSSIPIYFPALESANGKVINEHVGNLIPLSSIVKNISTALRAGSSGCEKINE